MAGAVDANCLLELVLVLAGGILGDIAINPVQLVPLTSEWPIQ